MPILSSFGAMSARGFGSNTGGHFVHTITTNQQELNLYNYLLEQGWFPTQSVELTIAAGVYIYSDDTAVAGLTIPSTFYKPVTIINNGYIIGKGGRGGDSTFHSAESDYNNNGEDGGPAISNSLSGITFTNASGAFIAGGGGGGGGAGNNYGGGGGGAGGGDGGRGSSSSSNAVAGGAGGAVGSAGSNSVAGGNNTTGQGGPNGGSGGGVNENDGADSSSGGGGGGRIMTNTDGVDALLPTGNGADWPAGFGGGQNQDGGDYGYRFWQNPTTTSGSGRSTTAGAGGGGYGRSGGDSGGTGGSGGAAIAGTSITVTNNGTILGTQA